MPRSATTNDAFAAIAEPRRRQIIGLLARRDRWAVGDLVRTLGMPQPAVSKHLRVLRTAGVVSAGKDGQRRLYRLNPQGLKPVHEWVSAFERFWGHQADRIRERAERVARERQGAPAARQNTPRKEK